MVCRGRRMIAHQHTPEVSNVNLAQVRAQVRGGRLLAKCQECGGMIHKPLFQPDAEWRDVIIKERYALVLVKTELDYLTSDGEDTEESGWGYIKEILTEYMRRFQKYENSAEPSAKFIEWEANDANS